MTYSHLRVRKSCAHLMINLNNYICALDIGSSKIAASVAVFRKGRIERIFFDSVVSKGVKDGVIVDSIEAVNSITKLIKSLRSKSGINVKYVYTNISGHDIITKHSRAIIPLAERGNKVISVYDVQRVNEQARILGSSLESEIIQMVPSGYTIDSQANVMNPVGLYSHKLEVDLYLVCGKLSSIQSLSRAVHQSGCEIRKVFFSGLATSRVVFDNELKKGVNLFFDIGSCTTEILIFKDGFLSDIEILPVGGDDMTSALEKELKIPFELAEDIKRSHGLIIDPDRIEDGKEILVKKNNLYTSIKQKVVAEIISRQARLVCSRIKDAVANKVQFYEVNNAVVVGRTVLLEGFIEVMENTLTVPVRLGRINNSKILSLVKEDDSISVRKYLTYLTCLGIICELLQEDISVSPPAAKPARNLVLRAVNRFKEVYQEYF